MGKYFIHIIAAALENFNMLDKNGSGEIDRNEALAYAKSVTDSIKVAKSETELLFSVYDKNNDGKITKKEWMDWWVDFCDTANLS